MKQIFLIGTEHQYFQVKEAIRVFEMDVSDCVLIMEDVGAEQPFIDRIRSQKLFQSIVVFKTWTIKKMLNLSGCSRDFIQICRKIGENSTDIVLWASHYSSDSTLLFLKIVKPVKFYLMDEGTASFGVNHMRLSRKRQSVKLGIKSLLYGKKIRFPKHLIYFTKFRFKLNEGDTIVYYQPVKVKNRILKIIKDEIIFLGSSVSDVGLVDESKYLELLSQVRENFGDFNCKYYPHRKESENKLNQITHMRFEIVKTQKPFEQVFEQMEETPAIISSFFCTSVLDNISVRYEKFPNLKLFSFDRKKFKKNSEIYEMILNHLKSNSNLQIIELS